MSESYVECMVARKTPAGLLFAKYLLIILTGVAFFASFVFGNLLFFAAIGLGIAAYFVGIYIDVEFEYLYLEKEITVDKVFHKSRRKRFATYEVEKIEIMAPINSYHLDGYKNRQWKETDLSSRVANQPDTRYVFYYNGNEKIIFEPNEALVKCVKNVAPRKVFMD
ncbi:MAG: hypothetical protein IK068_01750 [Lachnospiraceae bacterium]|nr:hypothetical protein [Lachnospiraceae bacterium]